MPLSDSIYKVKLEFEDQYSNLFIFDNFEENLVKKHCLLKASKELTDSPKNH